MKKVSRYSKTNFIVSTVWFGVLPRNKNLHTFFLFLGLLLLIVNPFPLRVLLTKNNEGIKHYLTPDGVGFMAFISRWLMVFLGAFITHKIIGECLGLVETIFWMLVGIHTLSVLTLILITTIKSLVDPSEKNTMEYLTDNTKNDSDEGGGYEI